MRPVSSIDSHEVTIRSSPIDIAAGERPTRIALLGLFGSPNLGNEATLAAFLDNVTRRIPGVQFVCIGPRRSNIERDLGIPLVPIDVLRAGQAFWRVRPASLRRWLERMASRAVEGARRRRAVEMLEGVQQLVIPGTGVIDDFGQGPLDLPTDLDRWTWAACQRGLPVSFLSVGVSTIQARQSSRLFRRALARADYVSFRDAVSANNARAMELTTASGVVPDLAFGLADAALPRPAARSDVPVIGFGVMGYYGWNQGPTESRRIYEKYVARVVAAVSSLLTSGHEVKLLTGDTRADDATVGRIVVECRLRGAAVDRLHAPPIRDFRDLLCVIAGTDIVVASRFHNVLLALMLRRPTVSIGYSDKNDGVMSLFGLRSLCHDIEDFDVDQVLRQVAELARAPDTALRDLDERLAAARAAVDTQFDELCSRWRTGGTGAKSAGGLSPTSWPPCGLKGQ